LADAFGYAVIFAYGAHVIQDVSIGKTYAGVALQLMLKLIFKYSIFTVDITDNPKFLELMILLANYYNNHLDYSKSRIIMSQAASLIQLKEFPSDLTVRVYSYLMVGSSEVTEKLKWFEMANSQSSSLSIYGRVNLLLCLPSELDKTQRYIITQKSTQNKPHEIKFIREAIHFIDTTEDILSHLLSLGTLKSNDVLAYCKSIIYGTRALIYTKLGLNDIALSWANETLAATQSLNLDTSHNSRIALIYSISASLFSGNTSLYESFIGSVGHLKDQWPIFTVLFGVLKEFQAMVSLPQQQYTHPSSESNLSIPFQNPGDFRLFSPGAKPSTAKSDA